MTEWHSDDYSQDHGGSFRLPTDNQGVYLLDAGEMAALRGAAPARAPACSALPAACAAPAPAAYSTPPACAAPAPAPAPAPACECNAVNSWLGAFGGGLGGLGGARQLGAFGPLGGTARENFVGGPGGGTAAGGGTPPFLAMSRAQCVIAFLLILVLVFLALILTSVNQTARRLGRFMEQARSWGARSSVGASAL